MDAANTGTDQAASTTRKDNRWDRLADSPNTLQRLAAGLPAQQAAGTAVPQFAPEDRLQAGQTLDVLEAECRKARAD
ncbi:hypothetical protein [Streptomyces sp. NPDC086782]|uniref:hypothetical protein n=1 Tax=Streptomyces sp. NPDC086782 TaxID=3365757 RepID=UPI00380572D2